MMPEKTGFVISLDGPDGVGKSSQVDLLAGYLTNQGQTVHKTRTSGGTPIGEELRKVSLSKISRPARTDMYISLAMAEALGEDIKIRKAKGETIIIDRSPLAIVAYNGYGSEMANKQDALDACEAVVEHLQIDLLIYLTAAQNILDERRKSRGNTDYFEEMGPEYHLRVRKGYELGLEHLRQSTLSTRITVINCEPDMATVQQQIIDAL